MRVYPITTVKPTDEPVNLGAIRAAVRADGVHDDASLLSYVQAAREFVEQHTGWRLMPQTVVAYETAWPRDGFIQPAVGPVNSVAITYTDSEGSNATLDAGDYVVRPYQGDAVLKGIYPSAAAGTWPALGDDPQIAVTLTVGFTDANAVPLGIKHAIILLASHWHANRDTGAGVPDAVLGMISTNKLVML